MKTVVSLVIIMLVYVPVFVKAQEPATQTTSKPDLESCEQGILNDKRFNVLNGKIDLLHTANPSLEVLSNNKLPTKNEKAALMQWVEAQKKCSAPGIAYFKSLSPDVGAIYEDAYADMYLSASDLYQGKITYGEFAKAGVRRHQGVRDKISQFISKAKAVQAEQDRQAALIKDQEQRRKQEEITRQREIEAQKAAYAEQRRQAALMLLIQQQQNISQQQQYQQNRDDFMYQACLNRAKNQFDVAGCNMENAGRSLGKVLAQ